MASPIFEFDSGKPAFPRAPCIYINILLKPGTVFDSGGLSNYLEDVASDAGRGAQGVAEWELFARNENLMAGDSPFISPKEWYHGDRRWIAISKPSRWEIHLYVGLRSSVSNAQSLINLATETNKWLHEVPSKIRPFWRIFTRAPEISGYAMVADYETGISIASRQSFLKTLAGKETAVMAVGLLLPCVGYLIKNYTNGDLLETLWQIALVAGVAVLTLFLASVIRHFFTIPKFTWDVDKLRD